MNLGDQPSSSVDLDAIRVRLRLVLAFVGLDKAAARVCTSEYPRHTQDSRVCMNVERSEAYKRQLKGNSRQNLK